MLSQLTQLLLYAGASAAPAPAEADDAEAAQIVVTASRIPEPPPGAVTRLEMAEIEPFQPDSLLEPLNDIAGVRAFSTGGIGGGSFVSIRGGEPNFTLVLLEGIKLNNPTNSRGGAFDFFAIDPGLVERIEVARDSVSAIHGSDALSGVINVRLNAPSPGETALRLRASAGSEGEHGFGASFAGGWKGGGLLAGASWFDSESLDPGSSIERGQALARLRQSAGGFEAGLLGLYAHVRRSGFPEDSGGPLFAVLRELERGEQDLAAAGFTLRRDPGARLRPNLGLSYSRQSDETLTPAIASGLLPGTPPLTADARFSRFEGVADLGFGRGRFAATAGLAWLDEAGRSDGTIDFGFPLPVTFELDRTTRSAFAEARLRPGGGFTLDAAGRFDKVSGRPGQWTGRLAAAWSPRRGGPSLFARIGEGYKLPSFYALGHPLIGNPQLRPERSRNLEAGVELERDSRRLRLALFDNRFRDLIDFDPILFTTVNRDRVRARGLELDARRAFGSALVLAGALTWMDLDSPTPLRGRPSWQGSARAVWRAAPRLELSAALRANSDFFDSSIPTGLIEGGGHAEADVALRFRLSPRLVLDAALRNLTDSRHQEAVGHPAPGRLLRATLRAELF